MPKRYFGKVKKRGPGAGIAVAVLLVILGLALGAGYLFWNGRPALLSMPSSAGMKSLPPQS